MRQTSTGIYIPQVREPFYICRLCKAPFYEGERVAFEQHVVQCASDRADEIAESSLRTRLPGLHGQDSGDVEWERWVREHPEQWKAERGIRD